MRTRITPNTVTFYAVNAMRKWSTLTKCKALIGNYHYILITHWLYLISSNQSLRLPPCYLRAKSYFSLFKEKLISLAVLNNWCSVEGDIWKNDNLITHYLYYGFYMYIKYKTCFLPIQTNAHTHEHTNHKVILSYYFKCIKRLSGTRFNFFSKSPVMFVYRSGNNHN